MPTLCSSAAAKNRWTASAVSDRLSTIGLGSSRQKGELTIDILRVVAQQLENETENAGAHILSGRKSNVNQQRPRTLPLSSSVLIHRWQGEGVKLDG